MNAAGYPGADGSSAWRRYLTREHAARDQYLNTTAMAHAEYLTGPWPDRDAYTAVERSAWVTYYAAGRAAWQAYRQETAMAALPQPAPPAAGAGWQSGVCLHDGNVLFPPTADNHPYPPPPEGGQPVTTTATRDPYMNDVWESLEAEYGPDCPACGRPWRQPSPGCPRLAHAVLPTAPAFTPNPEIEA